MPKMRGFFLSFSPARKHNRGHRGQLCCAACFGRLLQLTWCSPCQRAIGWLLRHHHDSLARGDRRSDPFFTRALTAQGAESASLPAEAWKVMVCKLLSNTISKVLEITLITMMACILLPATRSYLSPHWHSTLWQGRPRSRYPSPSSQVQGTADDFHQGRNTSVLFFGFY